MIIFKIGCDDVGLWSMLNVGQLEYFFVWMLEKFGIQDEKFNLNVG